MSLLPLLAIATAPDAAACGGFACSQARPVLQNAERIVFGIDELRDSVEMHVQITYEGDAEHFAWIVPVPANPDLFLTSGALFPQVAFATQPRFDLDIVEEGLCRDGVDIGFGFNEYGLSYDAAYAPESAGGQSGAVTIVGEEAIGPYETVTLQADTSEALLAWLDENDYDLPDEIDGALSPYVSRGAFFVALKLQKNKDAGDLAPLGLRYDAHKGMVPVQLTSVSATPDMRMEAYVFADTRAVPESYLHVRVNDAAIDWWTAGSNYNDVITQAANEAGGHAFATDYYGDSDIVPPMWDEAAFDEGALRRAENPNQWLNALRPALRVVPPEMFTTLEDLFGLPSGQGSLFYSCPQCASVGEALDADLATDLLITNVIEPIRIVQRLVDHHPKLSRMTSSLDAVEMTVDPVFVLNADMRGEEVRRRHSADLVYLCGNGRARDESKRRLDLADGRQIDLPSESWFEENGTTEFAFIADLGDTKAQIIEQTGSEGQPRVLTDHTDDFFELVRLHNRGLGFGCSSTGLGGIGLATGLTSLLVTRRRRG